MGVKARIEIDLQKVESVIPKVALVFELDTTFAKRVNFAKQSLTQNLLDDY